MPDALSVVTLPIYPGLEPAWGSAGICSETLLIPWLGLLLNYCLVG